MDRITELEAALAAALERIEVLEQAAQDQPTQAPTAPTPAPATAAAASRPTDRTTGLDRRRLLTRGGTAAVGAVLGGAAATIATATPAAAATGSFDSTDGLTALTATNTGGGSAIEASGNGVAPVVDVIGTSSLVTLNVDGGAGEMGVNAQAAKWGVFAKATGPVGIGVSGWSDGGFMGVAGQGENGAIGIGGFSPDGIGAHAWGQAASLLLGPLDPGQPDTTTPRASDYDHRRGEVVFDGNDDLWLCTGSGNPGTWVRVSGAGSAGPLQMLASPVRVYDSRVGYPPSVGPKTPLAPGIDRVIDCTANTSSLPTDATAAIVTITIANPTGPGWLAARANQAPYTGTSTLNWTAPGAVIATTTTTALGPAATIALRTMTTTDAIVDVIGYHR